jgi:hypothetical protein
VRSKSLFGSGLAGLGKGSSDGRPCEDTEFLHLNGVFRIPFGICGRQSDVRKIVSQSSGRDRSVDACARCPCDDLKADSLITTPAVNSAKPASIISSVTSIPSVSFELVVAFAVRGVSTSSRPAVAVCFSAVEG